MDYRILRLPPCFLVNAPAAGAFISIAYVQVLPMSLPRRAMEQMGFTVCCLTCDAADVAGSERCRVCIESHARAREKLTSGPATSKAERLAREFVTMLAEPSKHIDDTIHGESMLVYQRLIDAHQGIEEATTIEQVEARFARQRRKQDRSLIKDVANQSPWAKRPPDAAEREEMLAMFGVEKPQEVPTWEDLIAEIGELLEED